MKTYVVSTDFSKREIQARNKKEAAEKMKVAEYRVKVSAVHYDYCGGIKIK